MKDIELRVLLNKMNLVKDENVTIRMQLLDPSKINRGPPKLDANGEPLGNDKLVPDFNRI